MNTTEAKELFCQILDACFEVNCIRLHELANSILPELEGSNSIFSLQSLGEEISIFIQESDNQDLDPEIISEIESMIEKLSE